MTIIEIAEYIKSNYPNSCIAYNYDHINIAKEYADAEDLLAEDVIKFFYYEVLGCCGCGDPGSTLDVIRQTLWIQSKYRRWGEKEVAYESSLDLILTKPEHYGAVQFVLYILDDKGFIDHGSCITSAWLTQLGEMFLYALDYAAMNGVEI